MCDHELSRYMMINHRQDLGRDFIGLDLFLNSNVPDGYHVISVMMDKIVTDSVVVVYNILLERMD